jgi:type I restriction enzyme S subunit
MDKSKWEYKKLGDLCSKLTDGSHNPPKGIENSDYRMISSQNIFNDKIVLNDYRYLSKEDFETEDKRTALKKGDLLLTIVGAIGRCYVLNGTEGNLTLQRSVAALTPKDTISSRFLMYYFIGNNANLLEEAHGAAQKGIYLRQLSNLIVPVPTLDDQQRIVAELDCLNEMIALKQEQLKEFDKLAQSIFHDMFGDKDFPKYQLKDVLSKIGSGATPSGGNQSYKTDGISLIRSLNVHNNEFVYKDLAFIDEQQAKQLNNVTIEENDVLLNITGASVARCCIVPSDVLPARVNQHVSILRPRNELLDCLYLCHYLISCEEQAKLLSLSKSKAATREALPKNLLEKYMIKLPPLALQQQFAEKIQAIEAQKELVKKSIAETQQLLDSRMDYYFD